MALSTNNEFINKLTKANEFDRNEMLSSYLENEVRKILGLEYKAPIDRRAGFSSMGMDSIMSVEFRNRLIKDLGGAFSKALPATLLFNYPNIETLTKYLLSEVLSLEEKQIELKHLNTNYKVE